MHALRKLIPTVGLSFALFANSALAATETIACRRVSFADVGWTDITATTALASTVLEGLGYQPRTTDVLVPKVFLGLNKKIFHVFLGYWSPSMTPIAEPYLKNKSITVLEKPNLAGAKYTLAVPTYAAEAGLRDFSDINKFRPQLGSKIHGIEPGNDGNALIKKMIDSNAFSLKGFDLIESSEDFMLKALERSVKQKSFIVFLGWAPHPMNETFKITYLTGGDEFFGPNFGGAEVYTVVAPGYLEKCPNVGTFLNNLQFTVTMENQVMGPILSKQPPLAVAKDWLRKHPDVLDDWLKGVSTFDGKDGRSAVRQHLGL